MLDLKADKILEETENIKNNIEKISPMNILKEANNLFTE